MLRKEVGTTEFNTIIQSKNCQTAFEQINNEISKEVILSLPTRNGKYILTTDASNIGVGAVLSQVQNNKEKIISFYSALNAAEKTTQQRSRNYWP